MSRLQSEDYAHLHPMQVNSVTGEPFLRLQPPHANIILTPPRLSDVDALVEILSHPGVYKMLSAPPFPYRREDGEQWLGMITKESEDAIAQLKDAHDRHLSGGSGHSGALPYVDVCPLRYIREVAEDGSDTLIGEICPHRCEFPDVHKDPEERERLAKENADLPPGDPSIAWCIGDFLAATHHGRGIMTAALKTLMDEWLTVRMGARQLRVETFIGNTGSVRVFKKCGFVQDKMVEHEFFTKCGERFTGYNVLWWRRGEE